MTLSFATKKLGELLFVPDLPLTKLAYGVKASSKLGRISQRTKVNSNTSVIAGRQIAEAQKTMQGEISRRPLKPTLMDLYTEVCRDITKLLEDPQSLLANHVIEAMNLDDLLLKLKVWGNDIGVSRGVLEVVQAQSPGLASITRSCMLDIRKIVDDINQHLSKGPQAECVDDASCNFKTLIAALRVSVNTLAERVEPFLNVGRNTPSLATPEILEEDGVAEELSELSDSSERIEESKYRHQEAQDRMAEIIESTTSSKSSTGLEGGGNSRQHSDMKPSSREIPNITKGYSVPAPASNAEHEPQGTDESVLSLAVSAGPSKFQAQWTRLIDDFDPNLLADLRRREPPAHSLYEIETIINGLYMAVQRGHRLNTQMGHAIVDVDATQKRAGQFVANTSEATREMRRELGWNVREFDISLLRQIRRSSALSLVLGAGASVAAPCGAPSWPALVEGLLRLTIGRVMELWLPRPQDLEQLPPGASRGLVNERFISRDPGESERSDWTPTFDYTHAAVNGVQRNFKIGYYRASANRYNADEENTAVKIMQRIEEAQRNNQSVDDDILKCGADVCHDLCGQRLFTLMTALLYEGNRKPSETHRAIARLARSQFVPGRKDHLMGWDGIITYNYDDFMEQALADLEIPSAAIAMRGDEIAGDPNCFARSLGPGALYLPVYHVHGYTPSRPFLITRVPYVFATSGYQSQYGQSVSKVLERFQSEYLENPVHVALYVGCSFSDKHMNQLLHDAFERWHGRYHYALLRWRDGLADDQEPSGQEIEQESEKYLAMGIRPIWLRNFGEIPHIISELK